MAHPTWKAVSLVLFPALVFVIVGSLLKKVSHRECTVQPLTRAHQTDSTFSTWPLNMRLRGYGPTTFQKYWRALGDPSNQDTAHACAKEDQNRTAGWAGEEQFIRLDVGFPLVYGAALLAALLLAWRDSARPIRRGWAIAPVVALMVADWVENLAQLRQLSRWSPGKVGPVQDGLIRVASTATTSKWLLTITCAALLLWLLWRRRPPVPNRAPAAE